MNFQEFNFEQDNVLVHTSRITGNFSKKEWVVLEWQVYSQDMNLFVDFGRFWNSDYKNGNIFGKILKKCQNFGTYCTQMSLETCKKNYKKNKRLLNV